MKQKWCLSSENNKPELFALITVFFPPSASITDKLTLFLLRYWLNLPFLFFPLLLLSSWAFCGDAPARRVEPTLGCDCAQELEDCITACGERPQEWTEMAEKDREGERERGKKEDVDSRWCILLVCVYGGAKVKSEVWAGCKGGAEEWRVRGHWGWGWWSGSAKTNTRLFSRRELDLLWCLLDVSLRSETVVLWNASYFCKITHLSRQYGCAKRLKYSRWVSLLPKPSVTIPRDGVSTTENPILRYRLELFHLIKTSARLLDLEQEYVGEISWLQTHVVGPNHTHFYVL